jgi:hypothetical protein
MEVCKNENFYGDYRELFVFEILFNIVISLKKFKNFKNYL